VIGVLTYVVACFRRRRIAEEATAGFPVDGGLAPSPHRRVMRAVPWWLLHLHGQGDTVH
jgi:hypothetical protein